MRMGKLEAGHRAGNCGGFPTSRRVAAKLRGARASGALVAASCGGRLFSASLTGNAFSAGSSFRQDVETDAPEARAPRNPVRCCKQIDAGQTSLRDESHGAWVPGLESPDYRQSSLRDGEGMKYRN